MVSAQRTRRAVVRYGAAGLFVAIALGLRVAVDPWLGDSLPVIFLFGAVAAAVWFGGHGTAIAAAIAGYFASDYWFIEPRGLAIFPGPHQIVLGLAYGATSAIIIVFGGTARIARLKAEAARRRLERELRERKKVEERLAAAKDRMAADLARIERLHEVSTALLHKSDLKELLEHSLEAAIAIADSDKGSIHLIDKATGALKNAASRGFPEAFSDFLDRVHRDRAACGEARNESRRVVVEDVSSSPLFAGTPAVPVLLEAGVRSVQSTPLVSRSGRVLGVLSTSSRSPGLPDERALRLIDSLAREIADLVERNETEQALREADRRKDDFLAILAHELRNPLAPLRNGLEILRMSKSMDPATEEIHEMMERQVKHLIRMVDDLMEVSRITRGRIELQREPVEIAPIVRSAVETAKPLVDAGRHELRVSLPPEPLWLRADPVRLTQVLANLLNNAAKYTAEGGLIHLAVRRVGDAVEIAVRDNGAGIDPESLSRIFEPFTQADYSLGRTQGGLGIGLSLVRSLVEMHGGRVEARSEGLGRGSEFLVRLPLEGGIGLGKEAERAGETGLRGSFLVVDDNRDSADMVAMLLSSLGAKVSVAYDGCSALDAIRTHRPEVALLDLGMPGLDGLELARRIRQQAELREVILVAMTGWGQEEDRRRSRDAGFDHHLVKPVTGEALRELLLSPEARASVRGY